MIRADQLGAPLDSGDSARPAQLAGGDLFHLQLSQELEHAREMIEALGDALSSDAGVVMRHVTELQSIDIVGQVLGHIAQVLRSSDRESAVEQIGMCELKARLKQHTA